MSQLVVNYSKIETLVSEIDKVTDYFGNRKETHTGNARRIGSVADKRGNLASAISELYSRNSEIVNKEENLTSFRTELVNFQEEAEQADQRVANRISNETSSFFYKTGIVMQATEAQSLWDGLCEGVSDICGSIKDFYEEYKEEIWEGITLAIDTAFVVIVAVGFSAMILATAPIQLLLATGFVFAQVAVNLAGSLRAMDYYCIGDKETARKYANLDLKDGFLAAGRAVDLEEESGIVYDGCNLAANIVLLYAPATMLKNGIKNKVSKLLSGSADDVIVGGSEVIKGSAKTADEIVLKGTEYSAEYAQKLKDTYRIFENNGYEVSEHGLNRILGRINQGKIASVDEVVDALQTGIKYSDTVNGGIVIFKDGISIYIAEDGFVKTVIGNAKVKSTWEVMK